jgi:hypothetical protein
VAATGSVTVTVNQPSSAPTSLSSPVTICSGSSTTLTQTGGVLGTGAVWKWYTNSGYTTLAPGTVAADGSLTVSPTVTTTYYLRAETPTNGPCSQYVAGGNVTITVSQPSVAPTSLSSSVTICSGSSTTLSQTGGVLGTGASWKWYTDGAYNNLAPGTVAANGSLSVSPTATTTYYLRAESSTGTPCAAEVAATGSVTVTVNQPSSAPTSLSSPVTICSGSSTTLTQTGGVLGTGAVWKWYTNSGYTIVAPGTVAADGSLTVSPTVTTTYYLRAESTTGAPCVANLNSGSIKVTVNDPISITTQPNPSQTVCLSFPATFSVEASGTGLTYQWYLGTTPITGATSSTYNIAKTQQSDAGTYTVLVSGAGNICTPQTSDAAVLVVNQTITASVAPSTQTACEGTTATFTVSTTGTVNSYQWRKGGNSIFDGGNISGTNTATLTLTGLTPGDAGNYDVVVSGPAGQCSQVISNVATLTVTPTVGTPTAITVSAGTEPTCQLLNGTTTTTYATTATNNTGFNWSITNAAAGSIDAATGVMTWANGFSGSVDIQVTASGCNGPSAQIVRTVTIAPTNTAGMPSSTPTLCINTPLTNITIATTGATGIGIPTGLPAGVTAAWASNTITISGTPTASGTFNYSIPLSGGCGTVNATGTITVTPANTAGTPSSTPTLCVNTALTNITIATTGATGIGTPTNLPAGVTATWASNTITISGTPTAPGTFNYSIPLSGGCGTVNATGTITVTPTNTAGTPSSIPTLCVNTALTNITIATTGATGIGTPTGLPAGVTASWASNTITISGTPTVAGPFNYSIPLSGGCETVNATGTITVIPANTAGMPSSTPTLCVNTALTNITIATTGATGIGTPTNLPAGVTATWASNTITISGTPTASGTFNYSIPLSGGCGTVNATGTITVTPANTAGTPSSTPTLCVNTALTNITIATTGATGIGTPTNLPAGVTATWASNTITISGTPTAPGTFNYSIPLSGGCGTVNATGTITVTPTNTAGTPSSIPTLCVNTALTNITIATTGATGIGTPTGLPAGVTASWASNTITISGTPTVAGPFNYSIPLTGGCGTVNATGTITVTPASFGGTLSPALVTACAGTSTGTITLSGKTGNIVRWESSTNGGVNWTPIATTTTSYNYSVTQTTLFRAVIQSGPCSLAYSSTAVVSVVTSVSPEAVATPPTICAGQQSTLSTTLNQPIGITDGSGNFNTSSNSSGWGWNKCYVSSCVNAGADAGGPTPWLLTTSEKVNPPLISYSSGDNKFAVVRGSGSDWGNGDTSVLETPAFSLIGQTSGTFQFNQGYFLNAGASISIEISTDNGNNYSAILSQIDGQATSPGLSGTTITLQPTTISLANYIGLSNLKIRFKYKGSVGSSWALDNIALPTANPVTYQWTADPATPNSFVGSNTTSPVNVTPTTTTTYTLTTMLNGCATGSSTVTVTVNPLPTITLAGGSGGVVSICNSPSAQTLSMPYTATNLSTPATYSITWSAVAKNAGFVDVGPVSLPAGSISLAIPAGAAAGNYGGTVFLTNANGCSNSGAPFSVTINPLPTGTLSGDAAICKGGSASLTVALTGPGTISGTLSDGTPFSGTAGTITVNVNPAVTTLYTIATLTNGTCASLAANITGSANITVSDPAAIDVQPVSASICSNTATSFTVTATGTGVNYQWQVDEGSGFTNITDGGVYSGANTSTLNISKATADMVGYKYQAKLTTGAPCSSSLTSNVVPLLISYVWTGATGTTDWNTGGNWSDGSVPNTTCPTVVVPVVALGNYPVLSTGPMATIISLQIDANASAKITGNTMQLAGSITNNGIFDVTDGTVEFNGTTGTQNIAGSNFKNNIPGKNNTVKNLIISNNVNVANTAGDTLNITGLLSFSVDNTTLTTGDNLTLKSTKDNTASIGTLAANNVVSGQVEVERYLNIGTTAGTHPKSWQFLSTPAKGQSLVNSWMEGIGGITNTNSTGYGAQFTGTAGTTGYDGAPSIAPSVKSWDEGTGAWKEFANTGDPLYNSRGYFAFVRGDRSVSGVSQPATPTTLRSKGTIFTHGQSMAVPAQTAANVFFSIGNPYPSAVDMTKVQQTGQGISNPQIPFIYVWSPVLNEGYGVGGWNTYILINGQYVTSNLQPVDGILQSGQAFLVQEDPLVATTVTFNESAKVSSSRSDIAFREQSVTGKEVQLITNLLSIKTDGSTSFNDGTLQQFDQSYSGKIDRYDARKIMNTANNLAIKTSSGVNLVVERRMPLTEQDTIRYNMSSIARQNYRLEFKAQGLSSENLEGFVEDTYLNTRTPMNMEGTTNVDFAVTSDKGSYAVNRFRIVFKTAVVLPVKLVSVAAVQQDENIRVDWKVENEKAVKQYVVEKATDGVIFKQAGIVAAANNEAGSSYQWLDDKAIPGDNYYRIRIEEQTGKISYSDVVKVSIPLGKPSIGIYPNPITDGIIHLQLINQPKGRYGLRLLNPLGQTIIAKQVEHAGGNATEDIKWDYHLAHGVYQLQVLKPDGKISVIKVMY